MQQQLTNTPIAYFPLHGISSFKVPHLHQAQIVDVKRSMDEFLESVKNYKIQHVILNFSQTDVTVSEATFRLMLNYLIIGLKHANVNRIARIAFSDTNWEKNATTVFAQARIVLQRHVQSGTFISPTEAHAWILSSDTVMY